MQYLMTLFCNKRMQTLPRIGKCQWMSLGYIKRCWHFPACPAQTTRNLLNEKYVVGLHANILPLRNKQELNMWGPGLVTFLNLF